jgi:hypothetical protein
MDLVPTQSAVALDVGFDTQPVYVFLEGFDMIEVAPRVPPSASSPRSGGPAAWAS